MAKKSKKVVVRDEEFAELDSAFEDALVSLDSANKKTLGVLEAIEQGQLEQMTLEVEPGVDEDAPDAGPEEQASTGGGTTEDAAPPADGA